MTRQGASGGGAGPREPLGTGRVFLEFTRIGRQVKVVAIDEASGIEVSTFGPVSVSQAELGRLAVRKLRRRLDMEGG